MHWPAEQPTLETPERAVHCEITVQQGPLKQFSTLTSTPLPVDAHPPQDSTFSVVSMHSYPPFAEKKSAVWSDDWTKVSKLAEPAIGHAVSPVGQRLTGFGVLLFLALVLPEAPNKQSFEPAL